MQVGFRERVTVLVLVAVLLSCGAAAWSATGTAAEALVTQLPPEVIAFVASSGGDELAPAFEQSILGQMWRDPQMQQFYGQLKQALIQQIGGAMAQTEPGSEDGAAGQEGPAEASPVDHWLGMVKEVLSRPIVVAVAAKPTEVGGKNPVPIYGLAFIKAGPRRQALAQAVAQVESLAPAGTIEELQVGQWSMHTLVEEDGPPVYWGWVGDTFVLAVNDKTGRVASAAGGSEGSAGCAALMESLATVPAHGDALVFHVDFVRAAAAIAGGVSASREDPNDAAEAMMVYTMAQMVVQELGLDQVKSFTTRVGFDGAAMVHESLLAAPGPHTGLLAALETTTAEQLDWAPAEAMSVSAINCPPAQVYGTVMQAIKAVAPPEAFDQIEGQIAALEEQMGVPLRTALVENIAGPMVGYSMGAGTAGGGPLGGSVAVVALRDGAVVEGVLTRLEQFVAGMAEAMAAVQVTEQGGRRVHTWTVAPLAMMQVSPCWTVTDNRLVAASGPALLTAAVKQLDPAQRTGSIRQTSSFAEATVDMPAQVLFVRYADTKAVFKATLQAMQMFWPMLAMVMQGQGVALPMQLPTFQGVVERMELTVDYVWADEAGFRQHRRGVTPGGVASMGGAALGVSIMMPALARAREQAKRTQCLTHLRTIGVAIMTYQNDFEGAFPPDLETLLETEEVSAEMLVCPSSGDEEGEISYVYRGSDLTVEKVQPMVIVAYDKYENHQGDCRNVLFADAHIERMEQEEAFLQAVERDNAWRREHGLAEKPVVDGPGAEASEPQEAGTF